MRTNWLYSYSGGSSYDFNIGARYPNIRRNRIRKGQRSDSYLCEIALNDQTSIQNLWCFRGKFVFPILPFPEGNQIARDVNEVVALYPEIDIRAHFNFHQADVMGFRGQKETSTILWSGQFGTQRNFETSRLSIPIHGGLSNLVFLQT